MTGRNEVEEILEQKAWADRNDYNDQTNVALPPMVAIEAHEARHYRDCPMEYDAERNVGAGLNGLLIFALFMLFVVVSVASISLLQWAWNFVWAHLVH